MITLVALVATLALAPSAFSAKKMFVGFHDDRSFQQLPNRAELMDKASSANATILRTLVNWHQIALARPANAADPNDPAYDWARLDEFVSLARARGFQIVATIWGTPEWAGGSADHNLVPGRLADLTEFAQALATRYSGSFNGLPDIRMYTAWNEPNTGRFLMPQFNRKGKSVAPALYAKLFKAIHKGLKAGNPQARVAIGVTSPRGRNKSFMKMTDQHFPADFLASVARACNGTCKFDAVAHNPYSTEPRAKPLQRVNYPTVVLSNLEVFQRNAKDWFRLRKAPKIWITEYGYRTSPPNPDGVDASTQAGYARESLKIAGKLPFVEMYVWFIFRDDEAPASETAWESAGGLLDGQSFEKPAFAAFAKAASAFRRPF